MSVIVLIPLAAVVAKGCPRAVELLDLGHQSLASRPWDNLAASILTALVDGHGYGGGLGAVRDQFPVSGSSTR